MSYNIILRYNILKLITIQKKGSEAVILNNDSSTPLYTQLKQAIMEDINRGVYAPNEKLPTETELCGKYGVSRITVRKAVLDLVEEGYLIRQQGKGTFVKQPKVKRELIAVNGYSEHMVASGKIPHQKVISYELCTASEDIAQKLQIPIESNILVLKRVFFDEDQPLTLDIAHYSLDLFPNLNEFVHDSTSMHAVLKKQYRITPFRNTKLINVVLATVKEAEHLQCNAGDPIYEIQKTAFNASGQPIYYSLLLMPADRVTFTIDSPYSPQ